jgi:nucleoside-diphosphate-sugar epimerase
MLGRGTARALLGRGDDVVGPWADYARANIDGTRAVVAGCRAGGVRRLVHVSSPAVAHAGHPLIGVGAQPADPGLARGHYARSKAVAERVALAADSAQLAVLCLRPHLVWGPGDTQLVARIVSRARGGRLPVLGSGAALIDTTYVDNAVDALVAALDAGPRVHGEALVVSNGEPRTVVEILASLCAATGSWTAQAGPGRAGLRHRRGVRGRVETARSPRHPTVDPVPRRATHNRALVRPKADPRGARVGPAGPPRGGFRRVGSLVRWCLR